EYVKELCTELQAHALMNAEALSEAELFIRTALVSIVAIVSSGCAPLSWTGIGPRGRVKHKVLVRINAVAIQILEEERLARNAICIRSTEQQRCKIVLGGRRPDRLAAGVPKNSTHGPAAESRARETI